MEREGKKWLLVKVERIRVLSSDTRNCNRELLKNRTLAFVGAALSLVLFGTSEARTLNEILANKTMVVGVGATVPPLQYKLGNLLTGYEVDVIRAVGAEMGVEIVFRESSDISGLHDLLKSGDIDAVIGDVAITSTNERSFDVTTKYACLGASVLTFTPGIKTTQDLYGKKVGVTRGTVFKRIAYIVYAFRFALYPRG